VGVLKDSRKFSRIARSSLRQLSFLVANKLKQDGWSSGHRSQLFRQTRRSNSWKLWEHFIPPNFWPPNSPDLIPLDYEIWGTLQARTGVPCRRPNSKTSTSYENALWTDWISWIALRIRPIDRAAAQIPETFLQLTRSAPNSLSRRRWPHASAAIATFTRWDHLNIGHGHVERWPHAGRPETAALKLAVGSLIICGDDAKRHYNKATFVVVAFKYLFENLYSPEQLVAEIVIVWPFARVAFCLDSEENSLNMKCEHFSLLSCYFWRVVIAKRGSGFMEHDVYHNVSAVNFLAHSLTMSLSFFLIHHPFVIVFVRNV